MCGRATYGGNATITSQAQDEENCHAGVVVARK